MSMLLSLGKLLLAVGITFQAYTLYEDRTAINAFDARLAGILTKCCSSVPAEIKAHVQEHFRVVVVGLLAFSGLMVFFRSWVFKIPVLLGLISLFILKYYPFANLPSYKDQ